MQVHCQFLKNGNGIVVYKGKRSIGLVEKSNGDAQLAIFDSVTLSFNDLAIIQDNWIAFKEMQSAEK